MTEESVRQDIEREILYLENRRAAGKAMFKSSSVKERSIA